jgi:hypothetical protein
MTETSPLGTVSDYNHNACQLSEERKTKHSRQNKELLSGERLEQT